ncbi:MAG: hypothetical protein IJ842_04875 [Bacilli bacterium]|nr:hypothetical protein [Bacilli bacterium]
MKRIITFLLVILLFPIQIYAYSNNIIVGGKTIGIEINSKGVYVVGFYKVNNEFIGKKSGFQIGDQIIELNNNKIDDINTLNSYLSDNKNIFKIIRGKEEKTIESNIVYEDNTYKTGLYVKNQIIGVGTLSYIDPETKVFASLGHDIIEKESSKRFDIKDGNIYKAETNNIRKSEINSPGEKKAIINKQEIIGDIKLNESEGIFGIYNKEIDMNNTMEVSKKEDIRKGEAFIRTSIEKDTVQDYKINILSIDEQDSTKNILFEIKDEELLSKTGGIIQGMSGSPIIQNNKIIGVVNYVVIEDPTKGFGIFITSMLEKGDKIIS